MSRDPDNPLPFALAAWAYGQRVVYYFGSDPAQDRARSAEYARKARRFTGRVRGGAPSGDGG